MSPFPAAVRSRGALTRMRTDRLTGGFGFPIGCVGVVAAVIAADLAGATRHPWYSVATLGLVVLAMAGWTTVPAATGVALVGWALHSGFVLGRAGHLVFDGAAAQAAVVLALAMVLGAVVSAAAARRFDRPPGRQRGDDARQARGVNRVDPGQLPHPA